MQDRFRFRYFNKISNKMVECTNYENVDAIFECLKQQICYDNDISPLPYDHMGNGLIFMQCTGLKDKNEKLIYEGDIVEILHSGGKRAEVYWNEKNVCFELKGEAVAYNAHITIRNDYFEVIGNVYQNPELLNKEDK